MSTFSWVLLAACIWGIVPLLEKLGLVKPAPLVGLFYRCLGVVLGIILLGIFMLKPQQIKSIDLRSAGLLILGGFLASFVAQICFYNSLKIGEVSKVVPISGSYPFVAFLPRYTQKAPAFRPGMNGRLNLNQQESPAIYGGV